MARPRGQTGCMRFAWLMLALWMGGCVQTPEGISYPAEVLENAELRLVVDLPDPEKGRYRGTRFDLSG
ncbi:MAG TPA: hypothetical protein VJ960_10245, partial [Oceanipulchritudo sp.]|nr:hypothetical protein [Oceanipulchritudo sp.]